MEPPGGHIWNSIGKKTGVLVEINLGHLHTRFKVSVPTGKEMADPFHLFNQFHQVDLCDLVLIGHTRKMVTLCFCLIRSGFMTCYARNQSQFGWEIKKL